MRYNKIMDTSSNVRNLVEAIYEACDKADALATVEHINELNMEDGPWGAKGTFTAGEYVDEMIPGRSRGPGSRKLKGMIHYVVEITVKATFEDYHADEG